MKINRESGYVQLPSGCRGFGSRTGPTPRIVKLLFFGALVYLWGIGNEVSVWSSPAPAGFCTVIRASDSRGSALAVNSRAGQRAPRFRGGAYGLSGGPQNHFGRISRD